MFKMAKEGSIYFEGIFIKYPEDSEIGFDDDVIVRAYTVEEIIEKILQIIQDEGILEIYEINMIIRKVKPHKIIYIYNELNLYPN